MNKFPKILTFAAVFELLGIVFLTASLGASKPPAYLISLGGGAVFLLLGILFFLIFFEEALKTTASGSEVKSGETGEKDPVSG